MCFVYLVPVRRFSPARRFCTKKMASCKGPFPPHYAKLHRYFSTSFNLPNGGEFFQGLNSKGPYPSSQREKENRCLVFKPSRHKLQTSNQQECSRRSRATTAKKCTKKRDSRAKVVVLIIQHIQYCFFAVLVAAAFKTS